MNPPNPSPSRFVSINASRWRPLVQGLLLAGALAALLAGLWRGEAGVVLQKAVRVCLECMGIG